MSKCVVVEFDDHHGCMEFKQILGELVRCGECKCWCCKDNEELNGVCFRGATLSQMKRADFSIGRWRAADDFCSYGRTEREGE